MASSYAAPLRTLDRPRSAVHSTRDDISGHAISARDRGGAALGTDRSTNDLGRFAEPALLILVSLADAPKHGYAIMTDVNAFASSPIGPGTLYAALARLERRGLIEPMGPEDRRRPYRLTAAGSEALSSHLAEMRRLVQVGRARLGAANG